MKVTVSFHEHLFHPADTGDIYSQALEETGAN